MIPQPRQAEPILQLHQNPHTIRCALTSMYADVRADLLHLESYGLAAFEARLDQHSGQPGWEAAIASEGTEWAGYAYAHRLGPRDRWWERILGPLPHDYHQTPTAVLREIGVRKPWRGTGLAEQLHELLLARRPEPRTVLLVDPLAGAGRLQAMYQRWGYQPIDSVPPPRPNRLVAMERYWPRGGNQQPQPSRLVTA